MAHATYHFPRGFLWGTATAAHQVEGNNTNNNWYAWEQQPGRIVDGQLSGAACNWWNGRWREDLQRAAEGGQNAHRFSVEWSRIQPAPDRWDEEALDRYLTMLRGMKEMGLEPMLTLHHFTDPLWLSEQGGWENEAVVVHFDRFVQKVVEVLKDYVSLWCTINEPNTYAVAAYLDGVFPPGKKNLGSFFRVAANLVRGHAAAYHTVHRLQPHARVGMAINYRSLQPARAWWPLDRWSAGVLGKNFNNTFPRAAANGRLDLLFTCTRIPQARATQDFLGLNYYTRDYVAFNLFSPGELFSRRFFRREAALSSSGFIANEPEGLWEALQWARKYRLPIILTENGVDDHNDSLRPRYLAEHIHQMWRGVNFNWPIKGYFHWTLVDNFEWERGWTQRFGLWELDVETHSRRKRPSADFYSEICHENGLSADMVARYAPEVFTNIFPN